MLYNVVFITVALLTQCSSSVGKELKCLPGNTFTRLTIDSHRNETGHWESEVELVHGDANKGSELWTVDVHQRVFGCESSDNKSRGSVIIDATLEPPGLHIAGEAMNWTRRELYFFPLWKFDDEKSGVVVSLTLLAAEEALKACRERDGSLASLAPRNNRFSEAMQVFNLDLAYVDMHRNADTQHEFRTFSGDPVQASASFPWTPNHPLTEGHLAEEAEACGAVTKKGEMYDVFCDTPLPFFCEGSMYNFKTM